MNLEIAIREKDNVVKLKITSPDKPVVIELTTNDLGTPVTAASEQNESVSPVTEAATTDETLKAQTTALSAKLAAMNREYERVKKAAYRAGKRLEQNLKALRQSATMPAVGIPGLAPAGPPCAVPRVPEACPQTVPNSVPGDKMGQGQAVTSYYGTTTNTNTVTHNHVFDNDSDNDFDHTLSDPVMSHKEAETANTLSPEPVGNCLPFVPEDVHQFIPLANLPEVYQNLLQAWNNLPLPEKLKGLYPDVVQKLHSLLKEFGEAAVQKAIRMVADSPFLLGKITNTRGWKHICFGWLLNPANLKKILENKYRDRSREWNQGYECVTYPEYIPWSTVQNTVNRTTVTANAYTENTVNRTTVTANCYTENTVNRTTVTANAYTENIVNHTTLTANGYESPTAATGYGDPLSEEYSADHVVQSCFLDPEYMLKGLDPLTDQARSNLAWAAARLGLTKTPAA